MTMLLVKNKSILNSIVLNFIFLVGGLIFSCANVYANGNCTGGGGGTNQLAANVGSITVTDPEKNKAGVVIGPAYQWSLSGYTERCECATPAASRQWYWTATTTLPSAGDNNWLIYSDYLDAQLMLTDPHFDNGKPGTRYVPFTNVFTISVPNDPCNVDRNYNSQATGSHGELALRIRRPFIGTVSLASGPIANLYSCLATDKNCDPVGNPTIIYSLAGTVTVPQSCIINAGQIISIDLGTIVSSAFKTAGQKPAGFTDKTFNVPIHCSGPGIVAGANLSLRLTATPVPGNSNAIGSDNNDVGVVVTTVEGNILQPNNINSVMPFNVDDNGNASVTLKAYPVNTTGNRPKEGVFSALATIVIDFA
ncbi:fimbrial protein [Enterobacter asburiae]|uniref:fimbrial protein n=1 Tax=Enterobacter asburiae TaxID=61645 RepID=UPI002FD4D62E